MFGAAAMSLSSFCVVANALRLNLFKLYSPKRDKKIKHPVVLAALPMEKENSAMTKVMKVEGMMCPHCEMTVKKALEALPQVDSAVASHTDGTATVTLDDAVLKKAIEDQGYTVKD